MPMSPENFADYVLFRVSCYFDKVCTILFLLGSYLGNLFLL